MTHPSIQEETRRTIVYKTIVMGLEPDLQAGYVSGVSGDSFSSQLYPSLGVTLGVTRCSANEDTDHVFQLWSIPQNCEHASILKKFYKGHKAAIIVANRQDLTGISAVLENLQEENTQAILFLIVSDQSLTDSELSLIGNNISQPIVRTPIESLNDSIAVLSTMLHEVEESKRSQAGIATISEPDCERFTLHVSRMSMPPVSDSDLKLLKDQIGTLGLEVENDICFIEIAEGKLCIDLRSGVIKLSPKICDYCKRSCKRDANICIIGIDKGWASEEFGNKALLILAKVYALATRDIPAHVEKQIRYASSCKWYDPDGSQDSVRVQMDLAASGYVRRENGDLIDLAEERVLQRRLPQQAFNTLKRAFQKVKSTNDSNE